MTAGDFEFKGSSTLYGSIGAKQDITFNGKSEVVGIAPPSVFSTDTTLVEGDDGTKKAVVTVNLSQPSIFPLHVDYSTADDTAAAGVDYQAVSGTLTFSPLETSKTIEVPIIGDTFDEIDEAFTVNLNHTQSTVTIIDDDEPPLMSVGDVSVTEGNDGTSNVSFTVSLDNASGQEITVDYATSDGTAISGEDYQGISGSLTFEPGETTKTVSVAIAGDTLDEFDETFSVSLSNASNAVVESSQATATIVNDDEPPIVAAEDLSITEGDDGTTVASITVSLSAPSSKEISIDYSTVDRDAVAGDDYQATAGTLNFAPGETVKTIEVPIIGDVFDELDEAFDLDFSNPSNVTLTDSPHSVTVIDDDEPPVISIDSVVVEESDTDTPAVLTVTLDAPSNLPITVQYDTADETATENEDYQAKSGVITFEPGETTKTIPLTVIGDLNNETDETFRVNLTNPTNAVIAEDRGTVTIEDDDRRKGILLVEEDNFSVRHTQVIDIPDTASVLSITYNELNFDTSDTNSINDALEIALVDDDSNSLVHTIDPQRDALFNLTEGETPDLATGVTFEGQTIKVNLSDLAPGTSANLIVRLVNNDGDVNTSVRLTDISIESGEDIKPVAIADSPVDVDNATPIDFEAIEDVSASLKPVYGQTSFNEDSKTLYADIAVKNQGSYEVRDRLLVAVKNISDPTVRAINFDGLTPDGVPYYDLSHLIDDGILDSSEVTAEGTIAFVNQGKVQFDYDLVFLSQINRAPEFTTEADTEALAGKPYSYDAGAVDPDNDVLSYSLLSAPVGMNIDSATGEITWTPSADDLGNHAVTVQTKDGRGGEATQVYNLSVVDNVPNRPPVFTSTPVVDGRINQAYSYDSDAIDADSDTLTYSLLDAPEGLSIGSETGEISWIPNGEQLGSSTVSIQTEDGRGGVATQDFEILIRAEAGNNAPVIISEPVTEVVLTSSVGDAEIIDLSTWSIENYDFSAEELTVYDYQPNWVISSDNTVAKQTNNAHSSILLSDFELTNDRIEGTWQVETVSDDDFMGFVFGYQDSQHFYLFDWKQATQDAGNSANPSWGLGKQGMTIKVVNANSPLTGSDFWTTNSNGNRVETIFQNNIPWKDNTEYTYSLNFVSGEFTITVKEGDTIVDSFTVRDDTYTSGKFGFYNFSQSDVTYSGFTRQSLASGEYYYDTDALDPDKDKLTYSLVDAPEGMKIDPKNGQISWQADTADIGQHPVTVRVSDGRGGLDNQTFTIDISSPSVMGEIKGNVYTNELLADGDTIPIEAALTTDNVFRLYSGNSDGSDLTFVGTGYNWRTLYNYEFEVEPEDHLYIVNWNVGGPQMVLGEFELSDAASISTNINDWESIRTTSYYPSETNNPFDDTELEAHIKDAAWSDPQVSIPKSSGFIWSAGNFSSISEAANFIDHESFYTTTPYYYVYRTKESLGEYYAEQTSLGLENQVVYLDANQNGKREFDEQYTITDPQGNYSFLLPSGDYTIASEPLPGWIKSNNLSEEYSVSLTEGESQENLDFFLVEGRKNGEIDNTAPTFSTEPVTTAAVGEKFLYRSKAQDAEGDALFYDLAVNPEGMIVDPITGFVSWRPQSSQVGIHDVILRVSDPFGGIELQSFQVEVEPLNTPPVIFTSPLQKSTSINQPFQYQFKASDPDGDKITYRLDGADASAVIDPTTGLFTWTPTESRYFYTQDGAFPFTLTVEDERGGKSFLSFFLPVLNGNLPNEAPTITSTPRTVTQLDSPYFYKLEATDPNGDRLSYSVVSAPEGMTIDETGLVTWLPDSEQFGENEVVLQVEDGRGEVVEQNFSINVVSTTSNSLPTITSTPIAFGAVVGQTYSYDATATDPDGDLLLWDLDTAPQGMSIDPETGTLRWQPTIDQIGSHTVAVRVVDALGAYVGQEFDLNVRGANTAPNIVSTPITQAGVGQDYSYRVVGSDAQSDRLEYALIASPEGMSINPDTGEISWIPSATGSYDIEVSATDSMGASSKQAYTVEVAATPINNVPTITSTPGYVGDVDTTYSYQVVGADADNDALSYELITAPSGMVIDSATGEVTWTSPVLGQHQVVVGVNDGQAGVAQGYTLTVNQNTAPVVNLSNPPATRAKPGEVYRYDVPAYDPNGDRLFYSLDSVSTEKGFTIDELGRLRWTPEVGDAGNHPVTITITDEAGAEIEQSFTVEVVADTEAPKIDLYPGNIFVVDGQYQTDINSTVAFQAWATDNVGVTGLQLLVNNVPVAVDANGIANVTFDELGTVELKAIAYDAAGNIGEATATVDVFDFSDVDAPTVNIDLSGIEDNIVTAPVDIIGTIDDDNLDYYVLEIGPADGEGEFREIFRSSTPVTDGVIATFDPSTLANDAYSLRVTAYDNGGNFASSEETVYVEGELKLGNFQLSFTDLTIPVAGIPISVTRTYDTLTAGSQDDFGYGWRLEFRDTNLRTSVGFDEQFDIFGLTSKGFSEGDAVYITLPGGKRETFIFEPELDRLGGYLIDPATGNGGLYHPKFVSQSDSNNVLTVKDEYITLSESGQFVGLAGLLYNPADPYFGGQYTLTTGEGIIYDIDAVTGDLNTATDTNGNKLTFTDNGITSDSGVSVKFGRDGKGRITSVIDPDGKAIEYQYDEAGDLIAVTDREKNTTRYDYSDERAHYLDEIIDPLGRTGVKTEYDENGRLSRVIDVNGEAVELTYDPENSTQTVEDGLGNPTTYVYDDRGNVVTEVDALGSITKRTFDENDNILTQTDPEGNTYTYTYDEENNLIAVTNPLGHIERFTFNKFGEIVTQTDSLGNTTNYVYDARGNRLSLVNAEGDEVKYGFDTVGNVTKITHPNGEFVQFEYDTSGNVTRKIDEQGNETTYTYDVSGNQLTESRTIETANGLQIQTKSWTYDKEGRVTSITDFAGETVLQEYDASGNLTAFIDSLNRKTEYQYDKEGRLVKTIYPDGTFESTVYDAMGREIETKDAAGYSTYYKYDALGRLIETIYADNTPEDLTDNPKTKSEYDKAGRIIAQVDENENRTEFKYDAADRRVSQKDALGKETFYTYDANGNRLTETDASGNVTRFVYDALGRPIETIYADGTKTITTYNEVGVRSAATNQDGQTTYYYYDESNQLIEIIHPDETPETITDNPRTKTEYDELGRVTASIDELGNRTEYEYDAAGRQTLLRDAQGNETNYTYDEVGNLLTETDSNGHTTRFVYDETDRPIETIFHDGTSITTNYDELGREIATTDQEGKTTQYEYDPLGRLTAVIDAAEQRTEYQYDLAGNLVQIEDANNNITKYEYDAVGRRTAIILPMGQRSETIYDAVGNITSSTDFKGETIEYEYDELNRLTSKTFLDDSSTDYTYTLTGQIETVTDSLGITTYDYDVRDRLIEQVNPDSQFVRYTYDDASNRTGVITSSDTVTYTYNQNNQIETVTSSLGEIKYSYNDVGNLVKTLYPNNTAEIRTYDDLNRLIFLKNVSLDPDTGEETGIISSYDYTLDKVGNRVAVEEHDGRVVNYVYDDLYRLTQEAITDDAIVRTIDYAYDKIGNRLSSNDSELGLTTYTYNDNDWLLSEVTNGEETTYTYDNNGNTLSKTNNTTNEQTVYTWDDENRLIGAEITTEAGTTTTEYKYNADGVRVASIVDGEETRYLVDTNRQYAQVLEEYTPDGNVEVAYVHGHDLISQVRDGNVSFYHVDGLGSTRALSDSEGNVTDVYIYDAYGNVINSSGSTENNYLYTGEQYDSELGDYYLRARYYNPDTGRFTARDPFEGWLSDPISLAKYPYVHGNPVNLTDPTGLFVNTALITNAVLSTLATSLTVSLFVPIGSLRPARIIPDEVIDGNDVVRQLVNSPISIANTIRVMIAEEEMERAALWNDEPRNLGFPFVVWGREYQDVFQHDYDALHGMGDTISGNGKSPAFLAYINPGWTRGWLDGVLSSNSSLGDRDEYPYASTVQGGEFNYNLNTVSVRYVNASRNRKQGNRLGRVFYPNALTANHPLKSWFGVLALPAVHNSYWVDRQGNTHQFRPV